MAGHDERDEGLEATEGGDGADKELTMADILRLRKSQKRRGRGGGVEFRAAEGKRNVGSGGGGLVLHDGEGNGEGGVEGKDGDEVGNVVRRFAPQTGFGGGRGLDVDKHM